MSLLVDTSVWSLALRRDAPPDVAEVRLLSEALKGDGGVYTTGLVLQELLQGFGGASAQERIVGKFSSLPLIVPELEDHVEAASLRNLCRRKGVQVGTVDALIAQLAIRFGLALLTTDRDFRHMARHVKLGLAT